MQQTKNTTKGILSVIDAGFFFALMTFFVRLSGDLPTMEKAFFRNAVAALVSFVMLSKSSEGFSVKKQSLPSLFLRSLFGTAGLICNFYAIDRLNISDANMLNKLSPFFAIIASYFILKEKATVKEWAAVIVAFIGALFIIKPSFELTSVYALIGALGGLGAGLAYTFVRKLGKMGERGPVIVMFFSTFSCLVTLPGLILNFKPMSAAQFIILLLAGISATGGQLCITRAYTFAPAKEISVFDYTQVIFAAVLGFFFFDQIPDIYSVTGYVIIIGCAVYKWMLGKKE